MSLINFLLYYITLYIGITISKPSVLLINVPLIFDTQEINGAMIVNYL